MIYKIATTEPISSKIIEVNIDNIKYKKFSNLDGPVYTISKAEIEKIIYKNGDVENYKSEEDKNSENFATVYIIRPKSTSSWFNGMKIYENDKIMGILSSNTYLMWKLEGNGKEVSISSKGEGTDILRINPKNGKTYYIKQGQKTGWVKARPTLEFIDESEAKELLKKAKLAESKLSE